jgi:glycine/D-amino acid oxidase-like deaminating enzyme
VADRRNGVFAVTADNLPLLGPIEPVTGLWSAEAIWITHAAGAAGALAALMFDEPADTAPLSPTRFAGQPAALLRQRASAHYRDIYATG